MEGRLVEKTTNEIRKLSTKTDHLQFVLNDAHSMEPNRFYNVLHQKVYKDVRTAKLAIIRAIRRVNRCNEMLRTAYNAEDEHEEEQEEACPTMPRPLPAAEHTLADFRALAHAQEEHLARAQGARARRPQQCEEDMDVDSMRMGEVRVNFL